MSVTFSPAFADSDITGFTAECWGDWDHPTIVVDAATYEAARVQVEAHKALCQECDTHGLYPTAVTGVPEVNMSNSNAVFILGLLGVSSEYELMGESHQELVGSMAAAVFAERVAFAGVVGGGDTGTTTVTYRDAGGPTIVECGRPAGYADERLAQLAEVAAWAAGHGREVVWS